MPKDHNLLPPDQSDRLGVLFSEGKFSELEELANEFIERYPHSGVCWKALSVSLQLQGKECLSALKRAVALLPRDAAAHSNLGRALRDSGKLDAAAECFHEAIRLNPDLAEAHNNLGATLQDLGQLEKAADCYLTAIQISPDFVVPHHNLGVTFLDLGRPSDAISSFQKALSLAPEFAEAHCNLGAAYHNIGRYAEAEAYFRKALEINPNFVTAHYRLGVTLRSLGQKDAAAICYRRALDIDPNSVQSHHNLGVVLHDLEQYDVSIACFRQAIKIDPLFVEAYSGLGVAMETQWQLDDAVACFRKANELSPTHFRVFSNLVCTQHYLPGGSQEGGLHDAKRYGQSVSLSARAFSSWYCSPDTEKPLRVGLVSPDLRSHPVGYFLEGVLATLKASAADRIQLIGYMSNNHVDELTDRIRSYCEQWRSPVGISHESLAEQIRIDQVDILIDLSGHTAENRLPVFAWRPAPLQISWLGYFATTGMSEIDYVLADPWALPEDDEVHFVEKVWRLPETRLCFTPPVDRVVAGSLPALQSGRVTFGCFNNLSKINREVIALWAQVLKAVPESRLFLKTKQLDIPNVRQKVLECFGSYGVGLHQLLLEGQSSRSEYLAAYQRVDIALDPFPFPGGTTTVEGLWMGVPVLTLKGKSLLSRQGVSLLMNAGLADWIAEDESDYILRAVRAAGDLELLADLRNRLRDQVLASPIFDAPRFAGFFEGALRAMWRDRCAKKKWEVLSDKANTVDSENLIAMFNAGQFLELEEQTRKIVEQFPLQGFAWKLLGASLWIQGKDAMLALKQAAELLPSDPEVQNNLGVAYVSIGMTEAAMGCFRRALQINPSYAGAYSSLGGLLKVQGRLDDAIHNLRKALDLDPCFVQAHLNLGAALQEQGNLEEAVVCYRKALELNPDDVDALNNLGTAYNDMGRLEDAVSCYREALKRKPDYAEVRSNLLFIHNYLARGSSKALYEEARTFGAIAGQKASPFTSWLGSTDPERCLRVGLVSGDLRTHPVGYFLDNVVKSLSKVSAGRLELYGYSNHAVSDQLTERIRVCCRQWHSVVGLSDEVLARTINADGIDILIDLVGHTAHNRLTMFAWRPAPIQVTWLGYFATTGLRAIDYVLADPWTLPESEAQYFTERIWRLPETRLCFTPPEFEVPVGPLPALTNGCITFGCFNNLTKLNEAVVDLWSRILASVPGSRLFLKATQFNSCQMRDRIVDWFCQKGIAKERLILEGASPRREYLAAYCRVDIALDPFPYPGGATTAECLWMGVPVLTLEGNSFLSRQGVGLLMNVGMPEWVAGSDDDYVRRATMHAGDFDRLAAIRSELRQRVLASPVFDAARFANHLEIALRGMWKSWCGDQISKVSREEKSLSMKTLLHVGCGSARIENTTRGFNTPGWREIRLDINSNAEPDIVASMLDMVGVPDGSVDAVFSHHNIEHLYPHEVLIALSEFKRVLKPEGFLVLACPDLQSVCHLIAEDKLTAMAYESEAGPISPLDILYGHRPSLQKGHLFMAHRCGFTESTLIADLQEAGFASVVSGSRGSPNFDLWALASKEIKSEGEMAALAEAHFPE